METVTNEVLQGHLTDIRNQLNTQNELSKESRAQLTQLVQTQNGLNTLILVHINENKLIEAEMRKDIISNASDLKDSTMALNKRIDDFTHNVTEEIKQLKDAINNKVSVKFFKNIWQVIAAVFAATAWVYGILSIAKLIGIFH